MLGSVCTELHQSSITGSGLMEEAKNLTGGGMSQTTMITVLWSPTHPESKLLFSFSFNRTNFKFTLRDWRGWWFSFSQMSPKILSFMPTVLFTVQICFEH